MMASTAMQCFVHPHVHGVHDVYLILLFCENGKTCCPAAIAGDPFIYRNGGLLACAAAGSAEPQRGDPPLGAATADEPGARGTAGMIDAPRALKVTQALLRKTVANGCTPSEATAAADRGAAYMQRFGFTLEEATRGVRMPTQACSAPAAPPFTPTTLPPRLEPFRWRPAAQTIGWVISGLGLFCAYCLAW